MKTDIRDLWVTALLSGEYSQGQDQLTNGESYCCLGVLCELHRKMTGEGEWDEAGNYCSKRKDETNPDVLPGFVQRWAGLTQSDPDVRGEPSSLVGMNDDGYTFKEIAEVIKREL